MLVRLLYASRAAEAPTAAVLDSILVQSRTRNARLGVTGLLCVADDTFVQVLEGGRDEVCELYGAIVKDSRHRDVRLLVYQEIGERLFGAWTMGQVQLCKVNPGLLLKYFPRAKLDPFGSSGQATMALLQELVATASIASRAEPGGVCHGG